MESGPVALCAFKFCRSLVMPLADMEMIAITGNLPCISVGTECCSSFPLSSPSLMDYVELA